MNHVIVVPDKPLTPSLVARKAFRRRSLQERSSTASKSLWQSEKNNSLALEKTIENHKLTNKSSRSVEINYKKRVSASTYIFLRNSSEKDGLRIQNKEHSNLNSFTDSSAYFDASCSQVNLFSEGSNTLNGLVPHEWESRFVDGLSYRQQRRRVQFRTRTPARNKKKLEQLKAD